MSQNLRIWIKDLSEKFLGNKSRRSHRPLKNTTVRPSVEHLEDRTVPTLMLQTSTTQSVIFASYFDSAIYKIDAQTGSLLQTLVAPNSQATLEGTAGVTVGPDGNLYMSSQFNDSIVEYNFSTQSLSTFIQPSVMTSIATNANGSGSVFAPAGLTFGPDGDLYVCLNGGNAATSGGEVIRFDISYGNGQPTFDNNNPAYATVATGLVQPTEMTFGVNPGDTDNLYVSNSGNPYVNIPGTGGVVKITGADGASPSSSTFITPGSGGLDYPTGLNWGPNGKLYVTDLGATSPTAQGQVLVYNADGSFDEVFTSSPVLEGQFPSDAAFLANGDLLTANLGPTYPVGYPVPPQDSYLAIGTSGSVGEFNPDGSFNQALTASAFPADPNTGVTNISPSQIVVDTISPSQATIQLSPSTVNVPYSQAIMAPNGTLTVSNIENAIPGLTIPDSAEGILNISGTPTAAGTETFTVTATYADNSTVTTTYVITINPAITLNNLSDDTVGVPYNQSITATGGTGAVNLTVSNIQNAIPGLTIQATGTGSLNISGTPTAAGTETFTVTATDAVGATTTATYSTTTTIDFDSGSAVHLVGGDPDEYTSYTQGGFVVTPDAAIDGSGAHFHMDGTGLYTHIHDDEPGGPGVVDVQRADGGAFILDSLEVPELSSGGSLTFADSAGDTMTVTATGTYTFNWGPITSFSITPNNLLDSLDQRGYVDDIMVNSLSNYALTVAPAITLTPSPLPAGTINTAYDQTIAVYGGTGLINLAVSNVQNAIPGLTIPSSGTGALEVSGTPTAAGTETFTVTATDAVGATTTDTYSITANQATSTSLTSNPVGPIVQGDSVTFTADVANANPGNVGTVSFYYDYGQPDQIQIGGAVALSGGLATSAATTALPAGSDLITAIYSGSTGFSGSTGTLTIQVNSTAAPPSIANVVINQDLSALFNAPGQSVPGTQRSMVNDIVYTFSEPVNIVSPTMEANVFTIAVASGWTGTVPTLAWAPVSGTNDTEWAVTFSGAGVTGGSIANGAYTISVNDPTAITAVSDNQALSLATGGIGGSTQSFYRLYGDINGGQIVNAADNLQFKSALATYNSAFDINQDGIVNAADNLKFKQDLTVNFAGFTPTI